MQLREARAEVGYWQAMHAKAVERNERLKQENESLKARIKWLKQKLFGKKSEQAKSGGKTGSKESDQGPTKKLKGKQRGTQGHGRKPLPDLPVVVEEHELPANTARCPKCHKAFGVLPGTEDSEEVEIEVKAHIRRIRRRIYQPTCNCGCNAGIITAPVPPKLIPKGKFGISVWVLALLSKYYWQRPTQRLLQELETHGLPISQGTITGGFQRLAPLLSAVAKLIGDRNRSEHHWHADETRWMVFAEVEGKEGYRWYLWVFQSSTTVFFRLVPSRGAKVPKEHFGEEAWGIISADRYSSYKTLLKTGRFLIAFCWAHVRRDFLDLAKAWPKLESWALLWVEKIRVLYRLNDARLSCQDGTPQYEEAENRLKVAIEAMAEECAAGIKDPMLHPACRKVLESLAEHWSGLILFVKYPWIPMDNNTAERTLRDPVVGRKGYYGSGSIWSAELNADALTVFHTLALWGVNPRLWLTAYFEACANNGGQAPADVERFLPWNMSAKRLKELGADPDHVPKQKPDFKLEATACVTEEGNSPPNRSRPSIGLSRKIRQHPGSFYRKRSAKPSTGVNQMAN